MLPLFRFSLPPFLFPFLWHHISFPSPPLVLAFLVLSPSRASVSLTDSPDAEYPFKVNSNTSGCDQNGETRTQSTTLSFRGARFECLATKLATAGRRNGRQKLPATFCLPRLRPFHPIPPPYPFIPFIPGLDSDSLRKYRRIAFVVALRYAVAVTKPSLFPMPPSCHPTGSVSLSIFAFVRSFPRSKVGCNLPPASRKPVGWLFLFNADYRRSLVAGIPSGDKFVRLFEPRAHPIQPCPQRIRVPSPFAWREVS